MSLFGCAFVHVVFVSVCMFGRSVYVSVSVGLSDFIFGLFVFFVVRLFRCFRCLFSFCAGNYEYFVIFQHPQLPGRDPEWGSGAPSDPGPGPGNHYIVIPSRLLIRHPDSLVIVFLIPGSPILTSGSLILIPELSITTSYFSLLISYFSLLDAFPLTFCSRFVVGHFWGHFRDHFGDRFEAGSGAETPD